MTQSAHQSVVTMNPKMLRVNYLEEFLGVSKVRVKPWWSKPTDVAAIGWGNKSNSASTLEYAQRNNLPYWRLEDGFLSFSAHPSIKKNRHSLIVDKQGIYYDATSESDLESLLLGTDSNFDSTLEVAEEALQKIVKLELSKYNHQPRLNLNDYCRSPNKDRVLVIDQTWGDSSISGALATEATFEQMLLDAIEENAQSEIIVKTHPDVLAGTKKAHLYPDQFPNVTFISLPSNPVNLMKQVDKVYCVSSQMGFEALMVGKPVKSYGASFYSGWGLTEDKINLDRRTQQYSFLELFNRVYLHYCRYVDLRNGRRCTILDAINNIAVELGHY